MVQFLFFFYPFTALSFLSFFHCVDINECLPNPCQHGGQCVETFNASYICGCAPGYTGVNCTKGNLINILVLTAQKVI